MVYLEGFAHAFQSRSIPPPFDIKLKMNIEILESEVNKSSKNIQQWREEYRLCFDRTSDVIKCNEEFDKKTRVHTDYLQNKLKSKIFDYKLLDDIK